LIELIF